MHFYIILRRETGEYVLGMTSSTTSVRLADRYYAKKLALAQLGDNQCVCGPYLEEDYDQVS